MIGSTSTKEDALSRLLAILIFLLGAQEILGQSAKADVAVTFVSQYALKASSTERFWLDGGSIELGVNVWRGWGVAANVTGSHADSIGSSGVPLSLVTTTFGPRYRWHEGRRISIYGQGLVGEANAFHTLIPGASGSQSGGNGLATQVGGGVDLRLFHCFSIRVVDGGWLRSQVSNGTGDVQNTVRLASGLVIRFGPGSRH